MSSRSDFASGPGPELSGIERARTITACDSPDCSESACACEASVEEKLRHSGLRPTRQRMSLAALMFDGCDRHPGDERRNPQFSHPEGRQGSSTAGLAAANQGRRPDQLKRPADLSKRHRLGPTRPTPAPAPALDELPELPAAPPGPLVPPVPPDGPPDVPPFPPPPAALSSVHAPSSRKLAQPITVRISRMNPPPRGAFSAT